MLGSLYLDSLRGLHPQVQPAKLNQLMAQALGNCIAAMVCSCSRHACMLQVRMGEYNQLKGQLTALARKAGGSLAVRDLGGILKPGDMVDTENLTTLFVVVPAHTKGEWLSAYETLSDFVVRLCLS